MFLCTCARHLNEVNSFNGYEILSYIYTVCKYNYCVVVFYAKIHTVQVGVFEVRIPSIMVHLRKILRHKLNYL